ALQIWPGQEAPRATRRQESRSPSPAHALPALPAGVAPVQRATQGIDPFVEGIEVCIVAAGAEIDTVGRRTAPDELMLVRLGEHPVLREDLEGRHPQGLPLAPSDHLHSLDPQL